MQTNIWHNFRTQEYEALTSPPIDFSDYIPQVPAAQNLYALLIEVKGMTPLEAAVQVLSAACGRKAA